jgi:DNA-binding NarL/FixJ family response regulator
MTDSDDVPGRNTLIEFGLFALIALLMLADLAADAASAQVDAPHLVVEGLIMIAAGAGAVRLWGSVLSARESVRALGGRLEAARADARRWEEEARDALAGLGAAIERQFVAWDLTPAERAVGVLLLKGLSHKEAAGERQTSERTVRQQALAVYRKAGVRSRAELSAFFLRGLPLVAAIAPTGIEPVSPP